MVTIIVDGPIANNDDVTTPFETATSGTVAGNDDAPAGSVFTLQSPPSTSAGAITFEDDGTWTFQPADGFSGKVSYDYQVCAPSPFQDACATAKLTITVTPEGADDDRTTPLNQAVTIDVVANDPAQGLTVDSITQPSHGTAEIVDGKVVYTPAKDWSGVDTFTYLAKDATGQSVEQKVTIHVTPLGADDEDVTPLDTPKTLDVLANDPSGPNLTLESLTQPSHGTAEIVDGKVVYTPSAGWSGTDTFTYLAKDAAGQSVEQKVTIHVTPQGRNDIDTTPLNTPKDIDVLANDPSGPNLTVMSVSAPSHGTAVVNSAGGVTYTPAKDWSGVDTFEYVAHDASGQPVTQTVTVTVTPAGADDLDATPLNTPKTLDVLANDPSGPNLTLVSVTQPSHGTAEIVDGKVVYTPAKDWSGTDTFTYTAKDAAGQSVEQKVTITVTPEGKDDEAKTAYNTATDIAVLANDPSGAHLTVKTTTDPGHGTVAIQPDGTIRYTPTPGFSGLDTFTYTATDEAGQPVTQTVRVLVAPAGSDDRATTPLNTAVKIDVLANDPSKADITVTSVTAPGRGTAVVNPDGTVTYTPADGFSGQDTFTYTAVDGHGQTVTQKVTVTVTPAGTDDATTTQHDTPKKIDVLANDPSGPNLVLDSVSKPAHGTATVESDGTVLYTPDPRYSGTDTFTYVALDRTGQPVEQKVTVTVTPEGVDDTATTKASEPVDIDVLANELTDGLTVTTITQPSHGTSVLNADGTVTYTPADGFSGKDTFTYTAKDSAGQIVTQKVTVTVTPAGADDHATTPFQTPRTIDVVANDPTTGLTVQSVTTPGHGTAVVDPAGTVTYTPAKGFSGTDTFRYTATDALGQSVTQTVTVVVAPKGADDQDITSTDTPVTIDVLANDPTDGLTVQSVTTPGHGTATPNPDGTITYTPAPGYSGFDRFTYTAVDAEGQKVTQNVDITVTPKGTDDTATTPFETPKKIDVLANDPSTGLEVSEVTQGGHGSVVVNADGTVTYTPENGFSGLDRFTYTAVDAAGQKVTQTVTVSVAPKGGDDVAVTPMATPVDIDVLANDPATNLTVTTVATPGHGTATANPDGTVRYTPDAGFSGIDTFTYTATDSTGQTITQKVTVTVTPKGVDDTAATDYGTPVKIDVLANDPATTLQVTATTDPGHGTIVVNPDGTITYTPEAGFSGTDTFRYTATDSAGQKVTQTVTVLVRPAGSNDAETTPTDTPVTLDVLANDPVDDLTITSVSTPSHGTAISDGGGLVTYTPEPGFSGKDTFTYTATDPEGQKVVQTVTITVTPVGADDKASTPSDTAVKIPVLSNDPTTGLTVTTTTPPGHGTVVVDPDGAVTYTPQAGFSGTDTFTYTAKDSTGQAVTQNVTVTVTPRGADDAAATGHNTPVDIPVLANDPTKGLTVTGTTDPGHGTVSVGSGGVVTYTPEPGFSGKDTFTYTATDSSGEKVTQNVVVTVVPTGLDDVAGTTHDTPVDIPVLANDPTKGLTVTGTTDPGHGTVSVGSGGVITYTPEPGFSGKDTFTYTATDSSGQKITQTVTVTVSPSGGNDLGATPFETPVTIPVLANDPTTGLTVTGTSTPGHGTTTVNPDGTITYTPEKGFTGTDTFTYTAKDPAGQTITQTVTVTVTPAGRDDQASTGPSTPVTIPVLTNDPTPGLTVTGTSTPGHGTTTVNPDGTITYTPDTGFSGTDTFTYTAKDPSGQTITQTVTVVVRPDGRDDNATTPIGTPVKIDVLANDPSTGLTVTSVTPPKHGTATINPDGTVTYRPKPGFSGVDTFTYTATNADGQTVTRTVTVTVTPAGVVDTASTPANTPVVIDVLGNDPAGPSVTVVSVTNGDHGTVVINPDGTVTYTPDRGFAGDDTFTYTACDADDQCYERTVTVTIAGDVDQETVTSTTTPGGSSSGSGSGTSGGSSSGGTTGGGSTSGSGSATDRSASTLARTGSDMAPIASLGLTLSAAGAAIMAAARRRRRSA
jgi:CshA-type fibril repeat protein